MTIDDLRTPLRGLRDIVAAKANLGELEEYLLAATERLMLSFIQQARLAGLPPQEITEAALPLLQTLISIAENLELPLSDETEDLIRQTKAGGSLQEARPRKPSRPLAAAPQGPTEFSVFVDESGTASFDETSQPVLCLVGIIVRDDVIPTFERDAERLLEKRGLSKELEFHAKEFLSSTSEGPLAGLSPDDRYALLRDFLALGMQRVAAIHQMPMLKSMVKPEQRKKMLAQGLNAYSQTVVWFVITLDRACFLVTMPARYKYFYDRTDTHRKDIGRIFRALEATPNKKLRLIGLKGPPVSLESHQSRLIQLADVAGYYLSRYRQFEVPAFERRPELDKHEDKIREMYAFMKPKLADYLGKDLHITVDWKALLDFSLKPQQQAKPWRPPVGRRGR